MIDYALMKRRYPQHKAALTRAEKRGFLAVALTTADTIAEWDAIGAWPDDWSRWQRALDDTCERFASPVTIDAIGTAVRVHGLDATKDSLRGSFGSDR